MTILRLEPGPPDASSPAVAKVGGSPAPPGPLRWPRCRLCGQPLRFLFQLPDVPGTALALGGPAAVLVFQCENPETACAAFRADEGANAAVGIAPGTPALEGGPSREPPYPEQPLRAVPCAGEPEPPEGEDEAAVSKAGGTPRWPQEDATPACCGAPMRFVAQLHGPSWGLAFGDGGTGYLFQCARPCQAPFKFLWESY